MTITLGPEQERLVAEALRSGAYQSADEVVERALEILHEQQTWLAENEAKIEEGYAAAERGEVDGDWVRPVCMRSNVPGWPYSAGHEWL